MLFGMRRLFLFIDVTDRSKFSSDQKRFFIALSLYPLSFFANTPFNTVKVFTYCLLYGVRNMKPILEHYAVLFYISLTDSFKNRLRLRKNHFSVQ